MEFIIEFLVEFFFEVFDEGFISLCSVFVPGKIITEKSKRNIGIICRIISLVLFVGLFFGIVLLGETQGKSLFGWILIVLSIAYVISGIVLKIISIFKK